MATDRAGWSITRKVSENIEYTHKWAIESFDFAMGANMGRIKSGRFCIPGVPGEFHMVVKEGPQYEKMPTRRVADVEGLLRKEGPPTYAILSRNLVMSRFTHFFKGFHRAFNKSHPAFEELSMKAILLS